MMGFLDKLLGRGKREAEQGPAAGHGDEHAREHEHAEEPPAQDEWTAPQTPAAPPPEE